MAFETIPAAAGMNVADDPVAMDISRAQRLRNLLTDAAGVLRGVAMPELAREFGNAIDGLGWHYGVTPEEDRLLVAVMGTLWHATPILPLSNPPEFRNWNLAGGGLPVGERVRFGMYGGETIVVAGGGLQPQRFDGARLYQLGITAPDAPHVTAAAASGGAAGNKRGRVTYKQSYFDASWRESGLSEGTQMDFTTTANSGKAGWVRVRHSEDPQVVGAYLYANTAGGAIWYRIATLYRGDEIYEDNEADSTVNTGTQAPASGQNDVPQQASVVAVHKNHVFLNSTEEPQTLQVSNLDAPTQWASLNISDLYGLPLPVQTDQADAINALVPFGSLLMIFKRRGCWALWGDTPSQFQVRKLHEVGTVAPDSATRCDNVVCMLLQDGVYAASYQNGFILEKISREIEPELRALARSSAGAALLEAAAGAYADRRYYLTIGTTIYVYDFDNGAWSTLGRD